MNKNNLSIIYYHIIAKKSILTIQIKYDILSITYKNIYNLVFNAEKIENDKD